MEPTTAKPPLAPAKAPEQPSNNRKRSTVVASGVEFMNAENVPAFNVSRISPLSSNGNDIEAKIEEQHQKKPKVRFEAEPDPIDLSETQNVGSCAELLKENFQPEVRSGEFYIKKNNRGVRLVMFSSQKRVNQLARSVNYKIYLHSADRPINVLLVSGIFLCFVHVAHASVSKKIISKVRRSLPSKAKEESFKSSRRTLF